MILAHQSPRERASVQLPPSHHSLNPSLHPVSQQSASGELKKLFHYSQSNKRKLSTKAQSSKKKKLKMWSHLFVCLSSPTDESPPDTTLRAELQIAGLGEKKVSLFLYGGSDEIYDELIDAYPKLSGGGGYELLRQGQGRQLDVIPIPSGGYSIEYLKSVVHSAKIYIRPLQKSLDTSAAPCTDVSVF